MIVHGADVSDGRAGLWMELVNGQTLASMVGERGRFGAARDDQRSGATSAARWRPFTAPASSTATSRRRT